MRYPDYNTQSVWKRINQMLSEHFINNPQDCNNKSSVAEKLYTESEYQKWLKKPIHTFGPDLAFEMFTEAVDRAMNLVQSQYDNVDFNNFSHSSWTYDPVAVNESAYYAPKRLLTEDAEEFSVESENQESTKKEMTADEIYSFLNSFYGEDEWTWEDINWDWDMLIDEIGEENADELQWVMNDQRHIAEHEPAYDPEAEDFSDESEETPKLTLADLKKFCDNNGQKYLEAIGWSYGSSEKYRVKVSKDNNELIAYNVQTKEITKYDGDKIFISDDDGDTVISASSINFILNEPVIKSISEDELEPPASGSL